jgi:hypothetical protein
LKRGPEDRVCRDRVFPPVTTLSGSIVEVR